MLLIIGELFSRMNGFLWGVSDFLYLTSCVSFNSSSNTFMHGVRLEIAVEGCQEIPKKRIMTCDSYFYIRTQMGPSPLYS